MSKHMERDLETLRRDVLHLAAMVEDAIRLSASALLKLDPDAARRVVAADAEIDDRELVIQDECLRILALYQPVASDLRQVSTAVLITTDLERMGDLAVTIAQQAIRLASPPRPRVPERIARMSSRVTEMVRRSLDAFVNRSTSAAREVIRLDVEVDAEQSFIQAELVAEMKLGPDRVEPGLALVAALTSLGRIADHATNLAEDVIYWVDAEHIRNRITA